MSYLEKYKLVSGGMGGFLCPPGHPNHSYEVTEGHRGSMSVEYAAEQGHPEAIKMMAAYKPAGLPDPAWVKQVKTHFHTCWKGEGTTEPQSPGWKGAVRPEGALDYATFYIRRWYPDFEKEPA